MSWRWFGTEKPSAGSPPICRSGRLLTGLPATVSWSFALEAAPARSSGTPCCALMTALLRKPSVLLPAATTSSMSGFPDACAVASAHPGGGVTANVPDPPLSDPAAAEAVAVVLAASDPVVAEEVTLVSPPLDVGVGAGGVDEQPARARKAPNTNTENRFMATPCHVVDADGRWTTRVSDPFPRLPTTPTCGPTPRRRRRPRRRTHRPGRRRRSGP